MMAPGEELLALVTLLATSSLGMLVSATEICLSLELSRISTTKSIAGVTIVISLFTSTPSRLNYTISQPQIEDMDNVWMVLASTLPKSILWIETLAGKSKDSALQTGFRSVLVAVLLWGRIPTHLTTNRDQSIIQNT